MMKPSMINKVNTIESYVNGVGPAKLGFLGATIPPMIEAIRAATTETEVDEVWTLLRNQYSALPDAPKLSNSQPTLEAENQVDWDSLKAKQLQPAALAFAKVFRPMWNQRGRSSSVNNNGQIIKGVPKSFGNDGEMADYLVNHADKQMMILYSAGVWTGEVSTIGDYDYDNVIEKEDATPQKEAQG